MVALGEHLGADQNPRRAAMHAVEHALNCTARGCGIPIQARQRRIREQPDQRFFDSFGALSHGIERLGAIAADGARGP